MIYVDADAVGNDGGYSWENAFVSLQDALACAKNGAKVHVAAGTYKTNEGSGDLPEDRDATFLLKGRVEVLGGFAGLGEPDPDVREPTPDALG